MSQVAQLQARQARVNRVLVRAVINEARYAKLAVEYTSLVNQLHAVLGDDAYCVDIDPVLFSTFSDLHKDVTGVRPVREATYYSVQAWLAVNLNG